MTQEEQLLIQHEGLKLQPYKCSAGKLTIGVGRNIEDNGITQDEAIYMLRNDIKRCRDELGKFHLSLGTGAREAAIVNMLFNLGLPRFTAFKNMIMALSLGQWEVAAEEMLDSKWAKQVGQRAQTLADMVRTDTWRN